MDGHIFPQTLSSPSNPGAVITSCLDLVMTPYCDQFLLTLWPDPLPKGIMSDIKALGDLESPVAIRVSGLHREKPPAPQVQRSILDPNATPSNTL